MTDLCYLVKCLWCSGQPEKTPWFEKCCKFRCPARLKLGRLPETADIVVDHATVSRQHAVIEMQFDSGDEEDSEQGDERSISAVLCDLGSPNGTKMDGRVVSGEVHFTVSSVSPAIAASSIIGETRRTSMKPDASHSVRGQSRCPIKGPAFEFGACESVFHIIRLDQDSNSAMKHRSIMFVDGQESRPTLAPKHDRDDVMRKANSGTTKRDDVDETGKRTRPIVPADDATAPPTTGSREAKRRLLWSRPSQSEVLTESGKGQVCTDSRRERFVRLLGHSGRCESEEDRKKLAALQGIGREVTEIQNNLEMQFHLSNKRGGNANKRGLDL